MQIDIVTVKFAIDLIQTVVVVGISIYVWILNNHKVNSKKIIELEKKHNEEIDAQKNRLTAIETKIDHLPDREQISRIHRRIDELSKTTSSIEGTMKNLADVNQMILEKMMK